MALTSSPSLIDDIRDLTNRVAAAERAAFRSQTPQVMPAAPLLAYGGTVGYLQTTDSTKVHAYRVDGNMTAYFLDYDFSVSDYLGTATTLQEWWIEGYPADASGPHNIVTGTAVSGTTQVAGIKDLREVAGLDTALGSYIRFDIRVRFTGGSTKGVRLNKPLHLRTDS